MFPSSRCGSDGRGSLQYSALLFSVRIERGAGEVLAAECDGLAGSPSIEPGVEPPDIDACTKGWRRTARPHVKSASAAPGRRAHEVVPARPGSAIEVEAEGIAGLHCAVCRRGLEAGAPTSKQGNTRRGHSGGKACAHDFHTRESPGRKQAAPLAPTDPLPADLVALDRGTGCLCSLRAIGDFYGAKSSR